MKDRIEITRPAWMDQPNPLLETRELAMELAALAKENQPVIQSLRIAVAALAATAPDRPALLATYREMLASIEKSTGKTLPDLLPLD